MTVTEIPLCIHLIKKNEFLLLNLTVYFEENIPFYTAHKENDEKRKVSKRISRVHPLT
jgi:hypothetical protein